MLFGHFIHDILPSVLLVPNEILKKSAILIHFGNEKLFKEYFHLLNIPTDNFFFPNGYWCFTHIYNR